MAAATQTYRQTAEKKNI